jgi:NAD(P)-dependent dehydrogenase (short-subunit alcohol dehydrogenase family)
VKETEMATILITGANRGVGAELARQAKARGDDVIACARNPESVAAGLEAHALDVTDPEAAEALAAKLRGRTIDAVICNAGVLIGRGGLDDPTYDVENWARTMAVNVAGPFFTARAFMPFLRKSKGKLAIISSQMGSSARAGGGSYSYRASKAAATNLAVNLARDLAEEGVAVGAWHPGWVRTDMGGPSAAISAEESARGLLRRIDALSVSTTGVFEMYSGEPIPF